MAKLIAPDWIKRKKRQLEELFRNPEWGTKAALLNISLDAAVPMHIVEIVAADGPSDFDFEQCRRTGEALAHYGDRLLFKESKPKEGPSTAQLFNQLARALAVMAFVPGGVEVFSSRYSYGPEYEGYQEFAEELKAAIERKRKERLRPRPMVKRKRKA